MHVFKVNVTARDGHPDYLAGESMSAVCLVDSNETEDARTRAVARLNELSWSSPEFISTIKLPPNPDTANWSEVMRNAVDIAKDIGVALVVYPEQSPTH